MAGDYEEKYLLLRDENLALKKKKNEQEATIKRMYTKLAIIEEAMKKKRLATADHDNQDESDAAATTGNIPNRRDLETEKFVQALKNENAQLRKKNQMLMEKNRQLEEKMRQHPLKYRSSTKAPSTVRKATAAMTHTAHTAHVVTTRRAVTGYAADGEALEKQVDHARRVHRDHLTGDLEMALKNRLVIAEKHVVKLQQENEQLRGLSTDPNRQKVSSAGRRRTSGGNNNSLSDEDAKSGDEGTMGNVDKEHLRRELRDRHAQVAILNARYENLEANTAAEREIQEQTIEQLEHMNRQVHKLRSQLQDISLEKEDLEMRIAKAADLEKEMLMLRDQNRKLEERMTSLCESPFINDAFQRKERIDKLFDLEKQTQDQKTTIAHMTEENQKLHGVVKELQSNVKLMKQAKEVVEHDMEKLRRQLSDERNARSMAAMATFPTMSIQPSTSKPPSPKHTAPIPVAITTHVAIQPDRHDAASSPLKGNQPTAPFTNISSAMSMVSRRYPVSTLSNSLGLSTVGDLEGPDGNSIKHLRNRIHVLQLAHLKAIQELERCEKMLHAQTSINRELAQEIEELTTMNVSSAGMLQKRLKQLELSVDEKQQRIQLLEAQNRQLKYAREKLCKAQESDRKLTDFVTSSDDEDDANDDVASVTESLVMAARDLAPGEQLLEIWILGAAFDRSVISANASTFVLCDFYDFESQSTPLLVGHRPAYNYSSMFKVTVDAFFLRYLASETLVLEVHQAIQGDFRLVGRTSVPLYALLRSRGVIKDPEMPVKLAFGPDHDTIIGTLSVALRLAAPISEIWKLHLRSYPQDIQLLRKHRLGTPAMDPTEAYAFEDGFEETHLNGVNELQITVFACRGLRSFGKKHKGGTDLTMKPSSYVHYQILGFPDMFTNIVPTSACPEFDLHVSKQIFTLEVDACLLHFFLKFQLWMTVFDDQVDVHDDSNTDGAIGRCGLSLEEITKGESLRGWFPLRDRNDHAAGEISVLIEWKDPFQVAQLFSSTRRAGSSQKTADLHSLDYDQQHAIMRLFASEMDGRVNYRQFLTYALPPESLELVTSKIKERLEYAIDTEQIQSASDLFAPTSTNDPSSRLRNEILKDISSLELQKRLERFGVVLKDDELELLEQVFADRPSSRQEVECRKIQVHYLLPHVNPRFTCAERLLLHKIRHTLRVFVRADKGDAKHLVSSPSQPFERFDPAQCGFVSRAEFKRCLGVLGFELLDIDRAYKEFVENETRLTVNRTQAREEHEVKEKGQNASVDLDEETLSKEATPQPTTVETQRSASNKGKVPARGKAGATASPAVVDPRSEFDRRKELFLERMKAIASSSAKSSVYEQLEKQKGDRRIDAERANAAHTLTMPAPINQRVEQQLAQLHVPKTLHHDAARILQRQFRHHRMRHSTAAASSNVPIPSPDSIVEIDAQLGRMLKTWTSGELETLETTIIETIENELPKAKKDRFISRKQLGFVLSKIPRIAFEPELLQHLTRYFKIASKSDQHGEIAYRPLVHFICTVLTDPKRGERQLIPLIKTLSKVYINVQHVRETFLHVGDVNGTGRMTVKRFHEALARAGLRLAPKELRVLTVLLSDSKGTDVLYTPLLTLLRDAPVAAQMRQVLSRCTRFGIAKLREMILTRVSSDTDHITREQLHSILMQANTEATRFEPNDSYVLMAMTQPNQARSSSLQGTTISIDKLVLTMERLAESMALPLSDEQLNAYKLPQLQRLAQSTRSLLCPPYTAMVEEFGRFDWRDTGLVSLATFTAVVPRIGFTLLTSQQVTQLAHHFGTKCKGAFGINYRQFLDWSTPSMKTSDVETIEAKLRRFVADQSSDTKQIAHVLTQWRDAFVRLDTLSIGIVSRTEFATVCVDSLKLPLSTDELRTLLFSYDRSMDDRVDYSAFVQLNWKETSRNPPRKQVQFEESATSSLPEIVSKLHKTLVTNHVTVDDVAKVLAAARGEKRGDESVDVTQFIVCMKQLGVAVSPADTTAIFDAHGESAGPHGQKRLRLVRFVESTLGLPSRKAASKDSEHSLSKDEEHLLRTAVASALKYSRKDFDRALALLKEFCVVYEYGDIPNRKLWKHFERNGLTALLSKKGSGLLIQKFTVRRSDNEVKGFEANGADVDTACVALRHVTDYLLDASNHQPASEETVPSTDQVSNASSPLEHALAIVRELVVTCDTTDKDVRAAFEEADPQYTGSVPALAFKQILVATGLGKIVSQSNCTIPSETLVGVLVREFRSPDSPGGVRYAVLFARATIRESLHPLNPWVLSFAESLRGRIRLKAGFKGPISIDQSIQQLCHSLDAAFAHFDQQQNGFLTSSEIALGLRALQYDVSSKQVSHFMKTASLFRHSPGDGGLSRMEFDAFVMDPSASLWLQQLADTLYQPSNSDPQIPCVAQLSRLFTTRDQLDHLGVLSLVTTCSTLQQVTHQPLTMRDQRRLQTLFDVKRDGMFAYKLFLKVMSQYQGRGRVAPMDQGHASRDQQLPHSHSRETRRGVATRATPQSFQYSCDDVLRALYNQLSSIDFDSQVDIFSEYLRRQDTSHRGRVSLDDLESVMHRIGLKLSNDGLACLHSAYRAKDSEDDIDYQAFLQSIHRLHDDQDE